MGSCQSTGPQGQIIHPGDFEGIQIVCKTWKKTFSNLFDYNAKQDSLDIKIYNVKQDTRMIKMDGVYDLVPYQMKDKANYGDAVLDFIESNQKKKINEEKIYSIYSKNSKTKQQPWIAIKSLPSQRYVIKEGDMLRIGKQRVRVKQIIQKCQQFKEEDETISTTGLVYQDLTKEGHPLKINEQDISNYACKFCLQTAEIGNPLMTPCNCAGSSKYVHLKCVQLWLTKTINPRTVGKATVITWKPLICQLCHKTLPFKVYLEGKRYFTVNIPKPQKPYMVLNPIFRQKDTGKAKIYFLISFAVQKQMVIGRKADSDILISQDSTVSRHHSKIVFQSTKQNEGQFLLYDNQSKFGTLVMLRKQFAMKSQLNGLSIQLGGDLLQLRYGRKSDLIQNNLQDLINKSQSDSEEDDQPQEQQQSHQPINNEEGNDNQQTPAIIS